MSLTPTARPLRERGVESRDSGLRASILESALQLGVGSNCTVTKWMFNPVAEEEEDADSESVVSPSLTYASTAASDDSFLSNSVSPRLQPGAGIAASPELFAKNLAPSGLSTLPPPFARDRLSPAAVPVEGRIQFDLSATPEPRNVSPIPPSPRNKLRKLRSNGSESDGGYLSDAGKSKKEKKDKKKGKKERGDRNGSEYETDTGYLSEASRKKGKKEKAKDTESPTTDYETDGGGSRGRVKKRKGTFLSSSPADESDGGNLSESSGKRRGFFRLNSRSRVKKRDLEDSQPTQNIPPVPSLPLPIAERFLRSPTPNTAEPSTRAVTPASSQTLVSNQTLPVESESLASLTPAEREERAGSVISREGLTKAFRDAQSVHRPSIDILATFRNVGQIPSSPPPPKESATTSTPSDPTASAPQSKSPKSSARSPSRSGGPRPTISVPTTSMLTTRHVPAPLVLHSPNSMRSLAAEQYPGSAFGEYVLVTPQIAPTPNSQTTPISPPPRSPARPVYDPSAPSSSNQVPPSPPSSQSALRPHVLAYYGIPPPTPPPSGPLPDIPPPLSPRSPARLLNKLVSRSASADVLDGRGTPTRPPASPGPPPTRALPALPMPARSASESDAQPQRAKQSVPLISEPVPRTQRGRVSPFPVAPILPRSPSPGLPRKASNLLPAGTSPVAERIARLTKPSSADGYSPASARGWRDPARLDVQWQPRSASALERPRPDVFGGARLKKQVSFEDDDEGSRESEPVSVLDMDDDDDESVYQGADDRLQYQETDEDRSQYLPTDDDRSQHEGERPAAAQEDSEGDSASMWSQPESRHSFFDEEKSASARQRFVKQVEAMYGEYKVPPVPSLNISKPMRSPAVSS
ncbi:hypothetical protein WOLCODRAFT_27443 [Wolfiporia cocos MD-104 SS10]|uniref:Uncharacterized protein n=1 Tax=Wolfiporia cocos (strain MD-104) TaxID=742152 RepID=A0A2H3IZ99_WOLCO|nr:hypothetical protein WOLCODRAFT_27443 [Wolfiporia cocos MD-104 SS10]